MNYPVFFAVLIIGFVAFIVTNRIWEAAGGKVTKTMVVLAALTVTIIAVIMGTLTRVK